MKNVLIALLLIAVIVLGYLQFKPKDSPYTNIQNNIVSSDTITQSQAEKLVKQTWGDPSGQEGGSLEVTVKDNTVTAIYGQADDSVSTVKYEAQATYQDSRWILGHSTITQSCFPGRGHAGYSTEPCQ